MIKCPITGLDAERVLDIYSYRIEYNNDYLFIRLGPSMDWLLTQENFKQNKHILAGAILTRQLFNENEGGVKWFLLTADSFDKKLNQIIYPKTPQAKLDNLFLSLYKMQSYDGETIKIHDVVSKPEFYYKHFLKSNDECIYYLKELKYQGLINCTINPANIAMDFSITFKGLNHYLTITEMGNLSNKCFVAMSFDQTMQETRNAIKLALEKNDFEAIIIDEQLIDSSQTINDAIVAAIKSCKFCIADFSQQKDGVYFESGFAAGLGKPVIYTCHDDWFKKSHFDTNHFPHIIYKSLEELTDSLDIKIKAWIK